MKKCLHVSLLFNIALFIEFQIYSEEKEFGSLRAVCQWPTARFASRIKCAERCQRFKGFIIPGTSEFVCYHTSKEASIVYLVDEEINKTQCGYRIEGTPDRGCNPTITCQHLTYEQCAQKCSKYTVYVSRFSYRLLEISYCGETSKIKPRTTTLDSKTTKCPITRNDGTERVSYNCSCGVGEEGTEGEPMNKRQRRYKPNEDSPNEMVATCPKMLMKFNKGECTRACENLNGIFSQDNEFICFHNNERDVTGSKATPEYCECGIANYYESELVPSGKCPPERRIPLNNEAEGFDCPKKCANYKAYIFSPNKIDRATVYCERPSYNFRNLSFQIGKTLVDISAGNRKYRKYECKCGLRLSQAEINFKINTFLPNDGYKKVRNTLQIRNHSEVGNGERPHTDLFAELETFLHEEINDVIEDSNVLRDSFHDGENSANNLDSGNLAARRKRPSRRINIRDADVSNRGKKKRVEEIVQPTDLEIPWMSYQHSVSPNNTRIASSSSSRNNIASYVNNFNVIQNDEDELRGIHRSPSSHPQEVQELRGIHRSPSSHPQEVQESRGIHRSPSSHSQEVQELRGIHRSPSPQDNNYCVPFRSTTNPILDLVLPGTSPPEDVDSIPTYCHYTQRQNDAINNNNEGRGNFSQDIELGCDTLQNIGNGKSASPNIELIRDNTSQSDQDEYNRSNTSFLFSNVILENNEFTNPVEDLDHPPMSCQHAPLLNDAITIDNEEGANLSENLEYGRNPSQNSGVGSNMLENRRLDPDVSQNMESFNPDITLSVGDNLELRDEDIFHALFDDSMSFLFPNVTMEINDVLRPAVK